MSNLNHSSYQLTHLSKLYSNQLNCLLVCDGVGVGKTISAGYTIFHQSRIVKKPVVIVCPPILVDKWIFEMKSKFGLSLTRTTDKDTFQLMNEEILLNKKWDIGPVYITTFTTLSRLDKHISPNLGLVVIDEIHNIRNPKTRAFPALKKLCSNSDFRLGLSATPINNSVSDIAAIFSILLPKYSFKELDQLFNDLWGLKTLDCMSSIVTRFIKEQISSDFTERRIHNKIIEYPKEYNILVDEVLEMRFPSVSKGDFQTISTLRMSSSSPYAFHKSFNIPFPKDFEDPKLNYLIDIIKQKPNERWLIFSEFKKTAEYLSDKINDRLILSMSGDSSNEEREAYTYLFQKKESSVMIMTPVGSEGLDFQICSNLVNYDLHWNPMRIEQRIGRIDRIGQKKKFIDIYNFNVKGSIDDKVFEVIRNKLALVSDSFIEIQSMVKDTSETRYTDLEKNIIDLEIKNVKSFIKSSKFYDRILSNDDDFLDIISSDNCKIELWKELDWSRGYPWFDESQEWSNELIIESNKFLNLLRAYSNIRG